MLQCLYYNKFFLKSNFADRNHGNWLRPFKDVSNHKVSAFSATFYVFRFVLASRMQYFVLLLRQIWNRLMCP